MPRYLAAEIIICAWSWQTPFSWSIDIAAVVFVLVVYGSYLIFFAIKSIKSWAIVTVSSFEQSFEAIEASSFILSFGSVKIVLLK